MFYETLPRGDNCCVNLNAILTVKTEHRTFKMLIYFSVATVTSSSNFPGGNDEKNCNDEVLHGEILVC